MPFTIRVFAGLAEKMGGPLVEVSAGQETLTAAELKELLAARYPEAASTIRISFVAKNQAYAKPDEPVNVRDELALIPPVSGGSGRTAEEPAAEAGAVSACGHYELTMDPIDANRVGGKVADRNHGAALLFVGTTREYTQGQRTLTLDYDAYRPMALAKMEEIGREIAERWPGIRTAITHRLGRVGVGETSVVIAVSSGHRAESYEASRYAIERLKQIVPIWKKEVWEDGSEWKGHQLGPWDPTAPAEGGSE